MFFLGYFLQMGAGVVYSSNASLLVRDLFALLSPSMLQVTMTRLLHQFMQGWPYEFGCCYREVNGHWIDVG